MFVNHGLAILKALRLLNRVTPKILGVDSLSHESQSYPRKFVELWPHQKEFNTSSISLMTDPGRRKNTHPIRRLAYELILLQI